MSRVRPNTSIIGRPFAQVDVFTARGLYGNPVAVVLDGSGLDDATMQRFANWTNLSETTFVLPASDAAKAEGADYRLRIFTPQCELPFAGHPTLGSAHAVLEAGLASPRDGKLVQQCGVGLVEIAVPDGWRDAGLISGLSLDKSSSLSFRLPRHSMAAAPDAEALSAAIGAASPLVRAPAVVDVGPRWVIAQIASAAELLALKPDLAALAAYDRRHATTGLTLFSDDGAGGITVRSFAPTDGIAEDPVCGSGNGAAAAYRLEHGLAMLGDAYSANQGTAIGRDGTIDVRYAGDGIHIGGCCVTVVTGQCQI
ncbi:MAG: PhzF family phenazine biosynthesis protein [Sphingopyxis sp.]